MWQVGAIGQRKGGGDWLAIVRDETKGSWLRFFEKTGLKKEG